MSNELMDYAKETSFPQMLTAKELESNIKTAQKATHKNVIGKCLVELKYKLGFRKIFINDITFECDNCIIEGNNNTITGSNNTVRGDHNTIIGNHNTISSCYCIIKGNNNTITGYINTVEGNYNDISGHDNTIEGDNNHFYGYFNIVNGSYIINENAKDL